MVYQIGHSTQSNPELAVEEAVSSVQAPKLVLFSALDSIFESVALLLHQKFPESTIVGSMSYITFTETAVFADTLSLFAFSDDIECAAGVIEEGNRYPMKYADRIVECRDSLSDTENTICLGFTVAYRQSEEMIHQTLKKVLEDMPIVGISTGNRPEIEACVSCNGVLYREGCVFVLIKNKTGKIATIKENIYKPTRHTVTATNVDVENRTVYEYDKKPATEVMMRLLHTDQEHLEEELRAHPMGRLSGDEVYITDPNHIVEGTAISYFARIYNNTRLCILERDDYESVFRDTIQKMKAQIPKPSAGIILNCSSRSMFFQQEGWFPSFAERASDYLKHYIVYSGLGEQMNGQHLNQTMIMIAFE